MEVEVPPVGENYQKSVGYDPNLFGKNLDEEVCPYEGSYPNHHIVDCRLKPIMVEPNAIGIVEYFHERKYYYVAPSTLDDGFIILDMPKGIMVTC